jgi:type IV pilus assembly protein PilP
MARFRLWIFAAVFCFWIGSICVGCGGSEQSSPKAAKQVVKGKIPPAASKAEPVAAPVAVQTAAKPEPAAVPAPVEPAAAPVAAQTEAKPEPVAAPVAVQTEAKPEPVAVPVAAQTAAKPEPAAKPDASPPGPVATSTAVPAPMKSVPAEDGLLLAATLKPLLSLELVYSYQPEGKIDPFHPVFESGDEEGSEGKDGESKEPEKRTPQSPIEMVDLSQLKLTGVILAPSGNRALVQDATGKGYVIQKGTYVGNREGQVTDILSDRLIVTEKTRDDRGRPVTEAREIKLPKPPGEM